MFNLEAILTVTGAYGPLVAVVIATFLAAEAIFLVVVRGQRRTKEINARLHLLARSVNREAALSELRRARGLRADGSYRLAFVALNRLVLQSGTTLAIDKISLLMGAAGVLVGLITYASTALIGLSLLAAALAGLIGPIAVLLVMRARRRRKLEEQLPEAIDVMVRSLKAGHPIPVSIALVAREMTDPIGSEIGMVSDEMTYGLDLATAMENLRARAGQFDVSMLAVAISIQMKSGGNLAEILSNLSRMVRERAKMRRKIHALSAEGRFSAIALSVIPLAIYGIVNFLAPNYYADVRHDSLFMPAVYLGLMLWATGILVMRRMVTFKI